MHDEAYSVLLGEHCLVLCLVCVLLFVVLYVQAYILDALQLVFTHGLSYANGMCTAVEFLLDGDGVLYLVCRSPATTYPIAVVVGQFDIDSVVGSGAIGSGVIDK